MIRLFGKKIFFDVSCIDFKEVCCKLPDGKIIPSITSVQENEHATVKDFMNLHNFRISLLDLSPDNIVYVKNLGTMGISFKMDKKTTLYFNFDLRDDKTLQYILGIFFTEGLLFHDKNNYDRCIYLKFRNENNQFTQKMNQFIPDVIHKIAFNAISNNPEYKDLTVNERKDIMINHPEIASNIYTTYQKYWKLETL